MQNEVKGSEFKYTGGLSADYVVRSLTNAKTGQEERWLHVRGYASDTGWDKLSGKVYPEAIYGMVNCVNDGSPAPIFRNDKSARTAHRIGAHDPVIMDVDHSMNWTDQIGHATYAQVITEVPEAMVKRGMKPSPPLMYVEFDIDLEMSHGRDFKRALDRGDQLGLSIWGQVTNGYREWINRAKGEYKDHFHQIDLTKIAITSQPVNNSTLTEVIQRSLTGVKMDELNVENPVGSEGQETTTNSTVAAAEEASETVTSDEAVAEAEAAEVVAPGDESVPQEDVVTSDEEKGNSVDGDVSAPENKELQELAETTGLSQEALADLASIGAVVLPSAARAEEGATEGAKTESAETAPDAEAIDEVERAVLPSVFRAFETETREVIGDMSNNLASALETIENLNKQVKAQTQIIESLSRTMVAWSKEGEGRKGAMIMRSIVEEEKPKTEVPLGWELDQETRERIAKELVLQGKGEIATAMLMGWLKAPVNSYATLDPLLPGSKNGGNLDGAMSVDGVMKTPEEPKS